MATPGEVQKDEGASKRQKTEAPPAADKAVGRFKALGHVVMAMRRFQGAFGFVDACAWTRRWRERVFASRDTASCLSLTRHSHTLYLPVSVSPLTRGNNRTQRQTASLNPTYQYGKRATDSGDEVRACCCVCFAALVN